jgi:PPOX class probable F420-dependent enzyme
MLVRTHAAGVGIWDVGCRRGSRAGGAAIPPDRRAASMAGPMVAKPEAAQIPSSLTDLVTTKIMAHMTTIDSSGSPLTHVVWADFDGTSLLVSSPKGSAKGRNLRLRPRVALSVIDPRDPERWLSVQGEVTDIHDDDGRAFINKLCQRYLGIPYYRPGERDIFVITPTRVRFSLGPPEVQLAALRDAGVLHA